MNNTTIIPTGFRMLDALLDGGLEIGTVTVIGSRPGMGKTTLMRNVCGIESHSFSDTIGRDEKTWTRNPIDFVTDELRRFPDVRRKLICIDVNADEKARKSKWRELSFLAKERGIAVVVSVKLPPSIERREDKRPILSDFGAGLFGRGGAARYADNVIALYRESYYDPLSDWNTPDDAPNAEVIVLKSAGSTGTVRMRFDGKAQRWSETEE